MRGHTPRWLTNPHALAAFTSIGALVGLTQLTHLMPSPGWEQGRYAASLLVALPAASFYFYRFPFGQVFGHGGKSAVRKILGIVVSLLVIAAATCMFIGAILPGAWTYAFGEQVATSAHLQTSDRGARKKKEKACRFSVDGAELNKHMLGGEICLTEEEYRRLPERGWMLIEGRRSIFGTLVTNVSAEKSVETP